MAPEVFFTVLYGSSRPDAAIRQLHTFQPAVLHGYCRHRVRRADYPAIVSEDGHSVRGVYATGLTDANVQRLDYFEGDGYRKEVVRVRLLEREGDSEKPVEGDSEKLVEGDGEKLVEGEEVEAMVYVFKHPNMLELGEWDFEHFRKERLQRWAR